MSNSVIVTCAVTGGIHTPTMSPYLPVTLPEIAQAAIGPDLDNLMHMHTIAERLIGDSYEWSVLAAGRHQVPFATQSAMLGGNLRVGLEDSLYIGRGELARSNAQQVKKIRTVIEELGLRVATPEEARDRLSLKGVEHVNF